MCWPRGWFISILWFARPDDVGLSDALRLLPDIVRLLKRLAADPSVLPGVCIRLPMLIEYLALPFDLMPGFIPVLGYADDTIVVALVLRPVRRSAGAGALGPYSRWNEAICKFCGLPNR